ncbi:MAG: c-type cytochrome biogenesis protein CcsB [PVC group bacterium]|nr:c-type cytochrome biogenesis protein CcsB [PVC group bacterium]
MYEILFFGVLIAYLISAACFSISLISTRTFINKLAVFFTIFGFITHTATLILRTIAAKFPPMSNLYESMSLFAWTIVLVFLIVYYKYKINIFGVLVMLISSLVILYASTLDSAIRPLLPALQSYWLAVHVITCFLSYACFACAFSLGIMYLIQERQVKTKQLGWFFSRMPSLAIMDKINHNIILVGFVLLTAGIITGSVWAQTAWGNWWSWDPKETWALITWLIYAAYLHARLNAGWRGKRAAILSIIGFVSVLFTYLGVGLLMSGLHSYL